jgi:RNA polymerase sigma-70 factor (ECF subfamily)
MRSPAREATANRQTLPSFALEDLQLSADALTPRRGSSLFGVVDLEELRRVVRRRLRARSRKPPRLSSTWMAERDRDETLRLLDSHKNELRLHCYRMLGSSHDTDDVLQEIGVRAWRANDGLLDRSKARAWLYRIATNVCLDELRHRRARHRPFEIVPPSEGDPLRAPTDREAWIEPCPDLWLDGVGADASAKYELHESVRLAFVAALQHLTPPQRATLLLRDVVGLSAEETAEALDLSVEATTSALFRARTAAESKLHPLQAHDAPTDTRGLDEAQLARYLRIWRDGDLEAFVALLHDEVKTTMPPAALWIDGKAANIAFYEPMFRAHYPGKIEVLRTAANGRPAVGFYRASAANEPRLFRAIHTVELRQGRISLVEHFLQPDLAAVFGLPSDA